MIEILESIQVRAAQTITGAFGATSIPALNVETFLPPAKIQLERLTAESYIRIMTSPLFSTLQQIRKTNRHRRAAKDWDCVLNGGVLSNVMRGVAKMSLGGKQWTSSNKRSRGSHHRGGTHQRFRSWIVQTRLKDSTTGSSKRKMKG
jgi:hypothetical protein